MAGDLKEPDFAFLEASVIMDVFCVHLAAHKALTSAVRGALSSRSLHAELVFNVSGSKHVSPRFRSMEHVVLKWFYGKSMLILMHGRSSLMSPAIPCWSVNFLGFKNVSAHAYGVSQLNESMPHDGAIDGCMFVRTVYQCPAHPKSMPPWRLC